MPADFSFPPQAIRTDYLRPLAQTLGQGAKERSSYQLPVVARLKPGVTAAQAENEMKLIGQRLEHMSELIDEIGKHHSLPVSTGASGGQCPRNFACLICCDRSNT